MAMQPIRDESFPALQMDGADEPRQGYRLIVDVYAEDLPTLRASLPADSANDGAATAAIRRQLDRLPD